MKKRSGFGWAEFIIGLLLVALGVMTFINPGSMLTGVVVIYGALAVVMGIADMVGYVRFARFTGILPMLSLVSGIMSVMCGIMLLAYPDAGKMVLSLLFPVWFIAHCTSRLSRLNLIRLVRRGFYYYFTLCVNIIGLVLGFFMIFCPALTFVTMKAIGYIAAVYLILLGADSIVGAFAGGRYYRQF